MKTCTRCKRNLPTDAFSRNRSNASGVECACKECMAEKNRAYRAGRFPDRPVTKRVAAVPPPPVAREVLEAARLRLELERERTIRKDLEKLAMSSEGLRDLIGSLGTPNVNAQPEWLKGASRRSSVMGTAVLPISDIHYGEVVHPNQIGGCNEYNEEIARSSLRNTFRNAVRLLKGFMAKPKYDGLCLPLAGDLLSGNIHDELVETNDSPIQVAMLGLEEILIEGIGGMADEFGKVHVPCVTGNHGRMHKKPRAKNRAFENFEWSVYQRLAAYFKRDSRITFDIAEGPDVLWDVYNTRMLLTHGDQFSGGGGIGGIMSPIMRGVSRKQVKQQGIGDAFDLVIMGHWHQYIHMNRMVINGSVKGYDEYADQHNFPFEPAQQALFVMHPEVGCTFRMPVLCRKEA